MTPDQLLGLQRHARHKTLSPEITIETADAVPTVIAEGTGETVPITIEPILVERSFTPVPVHPLLRDRVFASRNQAGAFFGFALFGVWTLVEIAMLLAR